jgi:hypothetical protein
MVAESIHLSPSTSVSKLIVEVGNLNADFYQTCSCTQVDLHLICHKKMEDENLLAIEKLLALKHPDS